METIIDTKNRLMWMKKPLDSGYDIKSANEIKLDFAGFNDWRLPTIKELISLIDFEESRQIMLDFEGSSLYWSSTRSHRCKSEENSNWGVNFRNTSITTFSSNEKLSVRLVRDLSNSQKGKVKKLTKQRDYWKNKYSEIYQIFNHFPRLLKSYESAIDADKLRRQIREKDALIDNQEKVINIFRTRIEK